MIPATLRALATVIVAATVFAGCTVPVSAAVRPEADYAATDEMPAGKSLSDASREVVTFLGRKSD